MTEQQLALFKEIAQFHVFKAPNSSETKRRQEMLDAAFPLPIAQQPESDNEMYRHINADLRLLNEGLRGHFNVLDGKLAAKDREIQTVIKDNDDKMLVILKLKNALKNLIRAGSHDVVNDSGCTSAYLEAHNEAKVVLNG